MSDLSRLSINQVTTREQWSLPEAIAGYARHGVHAMAVWIDKLAAVGAAEAARMLRDHDMTVTGYCAGGLIAEADSAQELQRILDNNRRYLDEAAEIQSRCLVFIGGGLPSGDRNLTDARKRCLEGVAELLPYAKSAGVTLALEPLHPMVCAFRSVLCTLGQANDWCDELNAGPELGIALDTYNTWWDPDLEAQIARAGERIVAFHVSDWLADTQDLRVDRGMPGDGVIDLQNFCKLVNAAGYQGAHEVEILSARDWWQRDPDEVVGIVKQRYELQQN